MAGFVETKSLIYRDKLIFGAWDTYLYSFNAHKLRETIGISEDGQKIYARCMEDTLLAFSSDSQSQELTWAASCGYGYNIDV